VIRMIAVLALLSMGIALPVHGYDRFYYPYYGYGAYGYYGPYRWERNLELSRIRQELRNQRLRETQRTRRQDRELELLRQQSMRDYKVGARQACYYRSTGGFELCADLFGDDSGALDECEALVIMRNPGCNDVALKGRGERRGAE